MTEAIKVTLHENTVGYLAWDPRQKRALFEYDKDFVSAGMDMAPICMPLKSARSRQGMVWYGNTDKLYKGLPPTFADSLPDKWGTLLFNKWVIENQLSAKKITPLDHLAFIGKRAMGALEYEPALSIGDNEPSNVDVRQLFDYSMNVLSEREATILNSDESILWQDLIKISTSAGGKRPKAIVAINDADGQVMSGQGEIPEGFTHYILKYDDGKGFPHAKMEYIYYQIATQAGIQMMPSQLRTFGNVTHFLTERFDRKGNEKIHTQTLAAMYPNADSYEDVFSLMRKLSLPYTDFIQLFKIMVMNVLGRNVDDHNKNFSFLMSQEGKWRLAPAYDLTYCFDASAPIYANQQELSIHGKRDSITRQDLLEVGKQQDISNVGHLYEEVVESLSTLPGLASEMDIPQKLINDIYKTLSINS